MQSREDLVLLQRSTLVKGQEGQLNIRPQSGADFRWFPEKGLTCYNCPNPKVSPDETTKYTVEATLPDGRVGTTDVWVVVLPRIICKNQPRLIEKIEQEEMSFEEGPKAYFKSIHCLSQSS